MKALSREVAHMKTRQEELGAYKTVATINADMSVLDTCFERNKECFHEFNDDYPEPEVDDNGEDMLQAS